MAGLARKAVLVVSLILGALLHSGLWDFWMKGFKAVDLKDEGVSSCPHYGPVHGLFHPSTPLPRYIVTGGAGFIGSHFVKKLVKRLNATATGQVKVIDSLWRGRLSNLKRHNGSFVINLKRDFCLMDLRKADLTMRHIRGATTVIHMADIVAGVDYVMGHQSSVFRDNILINTHTLHAAKQNGIFRYLYIGTACSFPQHLQKGPGYHALHENQTYPADPETAYGWSKLMGEKEAELAQDDSFHVGLLRLHNVYGPQSDYSDLRGQVIPSLIKKALKSTQGEFVVWGSGDQYRDFIYVDDVVTATFLMLDRGMDAGVIQIGSANATSVASLVDVISDCLMRLQGRRVLATYDLDKPEGDTGRVSINQRAHDILQWQPTIDLKEGIMRTMLWLQTEQSA